MLFCAHTSMLSPVTQHTQPQLHLHDCAQVWVPAPTHCSVDLLASGEIDCQGLPNSAQAITGNMQGHGHQQCEPCACSRQRAVVHMARGHLALALAVTMCSGGLCCVDKEQRVKDAPRALVEEDWLLVVWLRRGADSALAGE